jgi:hypothetical protein
LSISIKSFICSPLFWLTHQYDIYFLLDKMVQLELFVKLNLLNPNMELELGESNGLNNNYFSSYPTLAIF